MTNNLILNKKTFSQRIRKNLPLILAFLVPVLVLFVIYISREVFPFGENMYLRSDMYHQYAPFTKELQRNLQEGGSLFYSWNIGLGTSFISTYAYYLASPVNWLIALFPSSLVPEFMNIMLILKSGLMSCFFTYYLIKKFKRNNLLSACFGWFYALSAYMVAFSWNVMWLDCLVLLPLVVMGLEALVKEGRSRLYTISLAVTIFTNYYIAIMICIFLVLYFVYLLVCENGRKNKADAVYTICQFVLYSIIAACMAAIVVLPAFFTLFITASSESSFPSLLTAYFNFLELIAKATFNSELSVFSGHLPNIFCTMGCFILVPLFCLQKHIRAKERAGKAILCGIFLFSFMFNIPTYIWHGFHFPNSLPCRQSFIYIFLILMMSYQALINIKRFSYKEVVTCALGASAGLFAVQAILDSDDFSITNCCISVAFILCYMLLLVLLKKRKLNRKAVMIVFMAICVAEAALNANATGFSITSRTTYYSDNEAIEKLLSEITDSSFYRVEKVTRRTKNDGTWNDYNSASIFSSVTVSGDSDLYEAFGLQGQTNSFSYYGHTPFTKALLGVKYELSNKEINDPLMTRIADYDGMNLYVNKYSMSLGFLVSEDVYQTSLTREEPFTVQNDFISKSVGADYIYEIYYSISGNGVTFTAEEDGRYFAYIDNKIDSCTVDVKRNGISVSFKNYESLENPEIIDLGDIEKGDEVTITSTDDDITYITVYPAMMDYEKFDSAMEKFMEGQMSVLEFEDTYVSGEVTVSENEILFTTIPYDPGWIVYVDGEKVNYQSYENAFITVELESGTHIVEFKYMPQGFIAGLIVSLAAIAVFVIIQLCLWHEAKRKETKKHLAKQEGLM